MISNDYAVQCINAAISNTPLTLQTFGFSADEVAAATSALVTANAGIIVYKVAGTPAIGDGHTLPEGVTMTIESSLLLRGLKLIRGQGSDTNATITLIGSKIGTAAVSRS